MKPTACLLACKAIALAAAASLLTAAPVMADEPLDGAEDANVEMDAPRRIVLEKKPGRTKLQIGTLGSFTPSMNDAGSRVGVSGRTQTQERAFRFTPSGMADDREAVTLGVTSRIVKPVTAKPAIAAVRASEPAAPTEVAVDINVGYRGFALSGGYSRSDNPLIAGREGVDLGLSYSTRKWRAALLAGADQNTDDNRMEPQSIGEAYSVELGGAYSLSSRLSVLGGVRYELLRPEAFGRDFVTRRQLDEEAGTVYLGTSFSF